MDKIVKPELASACKGGISMAEQQVCVQIRLAEKLLLRLHSA
jgi:hypothetical protein